MLVHSCAPRENILLLVNPQSMLSGPREPAVDMPDYSHSEPCAGSARHLALAHFTTLDPLRAPR